VFENREGRRAYSVKGRTRLQKAQKTEKAPVKEPFLLKKVALFI